MAIPEKRKRLTVTHLKPLVNKYGHLYRFGTATQYDDGIQSNFIFEAYEDARPAWRYPDLTTHVEYLATIIHQTISKEMNDEANYMRSIHDARREIKNWLEGPDSNIDRIIRAARENNWSISNKLQNEFPELKNQQLADNIAALIRDAFKDTVEDQSAEKSLPPTLGR